MVALENISFEVAENEIFGIIGADGAGKTTLFRILATLLLPSSGECFINGLDSIQDYPKIRQFLGYMPGNFSLYLDLSVQENLEFFASLFGGNFQDNFRLIEPIYQSLSPFKNRKAKDLSGGMKQKLALCCALIHKPKILLLDEPTGGVDALSRKEFWEILHTLKSQMTIIASTAYMDEATRCDRIALLHQGKILALDTPQNICLKFPRPLYEFKRLPMPIISLLRQCQEVQSCFLFGDSYHITFRENVEVERFLRDFSQNLPQDSQDLLRDSTQNTQYDSALDSMHNSTQNPQDSTQAAPLDSPHSLLKYRIIAPSIEDCFMEFLR